MDSKLKEAAKYFSQPGFQRMLPLMAQRYRGLGRIGGTVTIGNLTTQEQQSIGGVLGKDLTGKKSVTIGLAQFQEALGQTKFAGVDLINLLTATLNQDLIPKSEELRARQAMRMRYFQALRKGHPHSLCQDWLGHIEDSGPGARAIQMAFSADPKQLKSDLDHVLTALTQLPSADNTYCRLPMLAAKITGDPHGFDPGTPRGKYLLAALQFIRSQTEHTEIQGKLTGEQVWELLDNFGIVRDDLLNFVTCAGLQASKGQQIIPLWQEAYKANSVLNLPVRELAKADQVILPDKHTVVFVLENSGVFSDLADTFAENLPPIVCTHGQFRLATYLLLDKLTIAGAEIWYSGDFDPEGLLMAQRLMTRYPNRVKPWRYSPGDYQTCISNVSIPSRRLKQLDLIHCQDLQKTAAAIKETARAGYQENLVTLLAEDIRKTLLYPPSGNSRGARLGAHHHRIKN